VRACAVEVTERDVLGAEVEVDERRRRLARFLLEQLDVALRLLASADPTLEVAVVAHPDRGRLEALRQERRHRVRLLLVHATLEAVLRPAPEEPQGEMCDRGARVLAAGVVRFDEIEGLAPGASEQRAQLDGILRNEVLVRVEIEDPVARRMVERDVAGIGERAVPREVHDLRPERLGDLDGAVGRTGVDDDDLVDGAVHCLEAPGSILPRP
jgi:hypothetical protein